MGDFILRILRKYPGFVVAIAKIGWIHRLVSHQVINRFATSTNPRPRPFSLVSSYTSWRSLTDKTYTGRHLPEADDGVDLPPAGQITDLWKREQGKEIASTNSSMLFSFFAQWFVDSFLRTNLRDRRRNISNHEIDFNQLYGATKGQTDILRLMKGGKLKHQIIDGAIYPPYLFDVKETSIEKYVYANKEFSELHSEDKLRVIFHGVPLDRLRYMFAVGLEHGNSSIGYTTLVTVMLREHNRICDELSAANPDWDDPRLFETARNIMIVVLIKIVTRDYIAHIAGIPFPFEASPGMAEGQSWYRSNWITLEFNLLYRWHSMVPDKLVVGDQTYGPDEYRSNPPLIVKHGIGALITAFSRQRTGRIGLYNSPEMFFVPLPIPNDDGTIDNRSVMRRSVDMTRRFKLRSYNEYREAFSLPRLKNFEELTGDNDKLREDLKKLYNNKIDDVEWLVGIFAEKHGGGFALGDLMARMVAYDAFTHALTNPLLSKFTFNSKTFSPVGMDIIENTKTLSDIVKRNVKGSGRVVASFTTPIEPPGWYGLPILGVIYDTVDFLFLSGWKKFFTKRRDKYGSSVFKINLFMKTIAILDHDGFEPLFSWDGRLKKDYGFGWAVPPAALVGDIVPSVFQANPEHEKYKKLYIEILKDQAPTFEETFTRVFKDFSDEWVKINRFDWADEIERLCAAFVFEWYFGARPNVDHVRFLYPRLFAHKPLALLKLLPWSAYNKSKPMFEELLAFVKKSGRFKHLVDMARKQGLENEGDVAKQLLFLTGMNNFLGLQGMSKALIGELSLRPDLREELRNEMREAGQSATSPLDLADLDGLPKLDQTIKEVFRLHPPVFFIYGRAEKDFSLYAKTGTYAISTGDHLMGVISLAHLDSDAFEDPEEFRPERFEKPEAIERLIWPHGQHAAPISTSNHICPGKDVAMEFGRILCHALLIGFDWELAQKPTWSDTRFTLNAASPEGSMTVTSFTGR